MTVTLTNKTRRMKVYNLPHEVYCKALGKCACTFIAGQNERRICSSLTIPANDKLEGVDDAALSVPEISADVRSGHIAVDTQTRKATASKDAHSKPGRSGQSGKATKHSTVEVTNE